MSQLPKGWTSTDLQKLFEFKYGKALIKEKRNTAGSVTVYGSNGVVGTHDQAVTQGPTIIVGRKGSVGEIHLCSSACWPIDTTYYVDEFPCGLPPTYWAIYLKSLRLGKQEKSSTIPGISRDDIYRIAVAIPPLREQHRIVAKLERILSRVDLVQERLATIPRILKRFRQSVLAAACSGKLTADWRDTNGFPENNLDLPFNWTRMRLEETLAPNGIFDGPFGSNLKTSDYTDSGIRVIRLENVGYLGFIAEKETYISPAKYNTLIRHTVGEGDLIFASFIADEIRACVLPPLPTKAIAKADCFCLRPDPKLIDRTYLSYQLVSPESYNSLIRNVHGATRPRINTTQLRKLNIRICPLNEQQEIVRRVEAFFKTADALEARYFKAKAHVDKLTQSILAKAFRGELVPQDLNDEPASVLLERITGEPNGSAMVKRRSRKTHK